MLSGWMQEGGENLGQNNRTYTFLPRGSPESTAGCYSLGTLRGRTILQVFRQFKRTQGIDLDGGFPDQTLSYTTGRQRTPLEIQGSSIPVAPTRFSSGSPNWIGIEIQLIFGSPDQVHVVGDGSIMDFTFGPPQVQEQAGEKVH